MSNYDMTSWDELTKMWFNEDVVMTDSPDEDPPDEDGKKGDAVKAAFSGLRQSRHAPGHQAKGLFRAPEAYDSSEECHREEDEDDEDDGDYKDCADDGEDEDEGEDVDDEDEDDEDEDEDEDDEDDEDDGNYIDDGSESEGYSQSDSDGEGSSDSGSEEEGEEDAGHVSDDSALGSNDEVEEVPEGMGDAFVDGVYMRIEGVSAQEQKAHALADVEGRKAIRANALHVLSGIYDRYEMDADTTENTKEKDINPKSRAPFFDRPVGNDDEYYFGFQPVHDTSGYKKKAMEMLWEPVVFQNTDTGLIWRKTESMKHEDVEAWYAAAHAEEGATGRWVPIQFENCKTGKREGVLRKEKEINGMKNKVVEDYGEDDCLPCTPGEKKNVRRKKGKKAGGK